MTTKRGRKPIGDGYEFALPPDLRAELIDEANLTGLPRAEVTRRALRIGLAAMRGYQNPEVTERYRTTDGRMAVRG